MEFKNYQFEARFIDAEGTGCELVVPIAVQATSYEEARVSALIQAQNIVKINDEDHTLFMRLEKA